MSPRAIPNTTPNLDTLDEIALINSRVASSIDKNAARTREILSLEQAASQHYLAQADIDLDANKTNSLTPLKELN